MTTPSTINIKNATVSADGKWGTVDNYDQYGAGGGAGGSIQMTTKNLKGDGTISTRGGAGSSNGGGGGKNKRKRERQPQGQGNGNKPKHTGGGHPIRTDADGHALNNSEGRGLCHGWQTGTCTQCEGNSTLCSATKKFAHQCKMCLGTNHGASHPSDCTAPFVKGQAKGGGKGKKRKQP